MGRRGAGLAGMPGREIEGKEEAEIETHADRQTLAHTHTQAEVTQTDPATRCSDKLAVKCSISRPN